MAKKSIIERQKNRSKIIKKYFLIRKYIKGKIYSSKDFDEKLYYHGELESLPRNSSLSRFFWLCKNQFIYNSLTFDFQNIIYVYIITFNKELNLNDFNKNRCIVTGRSKGYYRFFGISRHLLRELAHQGLLPGIIKSSW